VGRDSWQEEFTKEEEYSFAVEFDLVMENYLEHYSSDMEMPKHPLVSRQSLARYAHRP
jgi:hypothetical protein